MDWIVGQVKGYDALGLVVSSNKALLFHHNCHYQVRKGILCSKVEREKCISSSPCLADSDVVLFVR
jgi:hypothetical protein